MAARGVRGASCQVCQGREAAAAAGEGEGEGEGPPRLNPRHTWYLAHSMMIGMRPNTLLMPSCATDLRGVRARAGAVGEAA